MRPRTLSIELPVNGNIYEVKATPYVIPSKEPRFRVSIDGSPVYIFGWDNHLDRFAILDDSPEMMRDNLELAIAAKLQDTVHYKHAA